MKLIMVLISTLFLFEFETAFAQELIIYPAMGQSNEQMERDKFECYSWATNQTGFDPAAPPPVITAAPESRSVTRGTARGGLGGAALGAGIGAIAGGAGRGAGIGALAGGTLGGLRSRSQNDRNRQVQVQAQQQQFALYAQGRDSYNRAFGACLEGRGYTVR
jgi:hypothetical protein